ncbi:hypothetical protein [Microbacterium oxydans]|uniref:hypothetical protein n=1 Tax=Microbacterium oxydans TaxID=82380 RepID=UPI000B81BC68|nr:hypothetical protein [Microbacterium oxydans]
MSRRLLRTIAVVALLGGAVTGGSGCALACPAIGWFNGATLDASAVPGAAGVQFCVEGECSPAPGTEPTSSTNLFMATPQDDGTWALGFDMSTPEVVEIRLFDAQNTLIHESEESIAWTHSDEPCGGPSTADPIVLEP